MLMTPTVAGMAPAPEVGRGGGAADEVGAAPVARTGTPWGDPHVGANMVKIGCVGLHDHAGVDEVGINARTRVEVKD